MININREAQLSVIGAMLMKPQEVLPEVTARLKAEDFVLGELRSIFTACKELYQENTPVDVVTVMGKLSSSYKPLLVEACAAAPTISNFKTYVEIVADTARRLRALEKAKELAEALEEGEGLDACQEMAVKTCESLNDTTAGEAYSIKEMFERFYATKMTPKEYIKTGIDRLDKYTFIDKGDYVVIGARPSAGKTALTLQMMLYMARERNVVYFSLETNPDKLMDRMISNFTKTSLSAIKRNEVTPEEWVTIAEAYDRLTRLKIHTVPAAGWTAAQIRAKAVQLKAEVIFIDYLSLIKSEGNNRYEKVSNISCDLHTMAQQSGITVFALSQLSREGKGEPDMSHLRESGQIEQDADLILLLHSLDTEDPSAPRKLTIAKNKEGSVGIVTLAFQGEYQRFYDYENRYLARGKHGN